MDIARVCADNSDVIAHGVGVHPVPVQWVDGTIFLRFTFTAEELALILEGGALLIGIKSPSGSFTPVCPMVTSNSEPVEYLELKRLAGELNKPV